MGKRAIAITLGALLAAVGVIQLLSDEGVPGTRARAIRLQAAREQPDARAPRPSSTTERERDDGEPRGGAAPSDASQDDDDDAELVTGPAPCPAGRDADDCEYGEDGEDESEGRADERDEHHERDDEAADDPGDD